MKDYFVDTVVDAVYVMGNIKTGFGSSMISKLRTLLSFDSKPAAIVVDIVVIQYLYQGMDDIKMQDQGDHHCSISAL